MTQQSYSLEDGKEVRFFKKTILAYPVGPRSSKKVQVRQAAQKQDKKGWSQRGPQVNLGTLGRRRSVRWRFMGLRPEGAVFCEERISKAALGKRPLLERGGKNVANKHNRKTKNPLA
ncbi:hypothetical protein MPNT_220023 [Candidatus Methylacidithermus pantelleriae]|uniref:Uncharacterized protein n=1 Tax=Candidatus Methylacidithermus pantelleriae TaxID=2744239 RepID=A0A8J2FSM9_9BACT|nr:hypothetical protein MPNT_220023 [Candidatus Methylacidithermus pantelleriae]